jgi:hypothetical protein
VRREELGAAEHPRQVGSLSQPKSTIASARIATTMGWLWGSGNGPTDNLDSSLQDFLKKEAPTGPKPSLPSAPTPKPAEPAQQTEPEKPSVPPQSQFQDGRYAHLWKNYTPQNVLDDRGKNEQDKLRDLVEAYNDRKAGIGRIAMENCAVEYMEQYDCWTNPKTWISLRTLCHAESKRFNRCYDTQSKFLKALGYLTMEERSQEEDEKIQMHADRLYQRLRAQEAEMEGRERPKFESLMADAKLARTIASNTKTTAEAEVDPWAKVKPEKKIEYEKKLAELPPEQQEIERLAAAGELKAQSGLAKEVDHTFIEERIARMKRRESGQATFGDQIKYWWGWG